MFLSPDGVVPVVQQDAASPALQQLVFVIVLVGPSFLLCPCFCLLAPFAPGMPAA